MTGGTSGFGAIAAERLMRSGSVRLISGARRPISAGESLQLDLGELDSVRAFAARIGEGPGVTAVDALVLNAGIVRPTLNTRTAAGTALADLALGRVTPPKGHTYAALRRGRLRWVQPSQLARRDDLAQALWSDSARLVGLPD
ncbi:hypothetical protein AB0I00_30720 [Streptomyces sp. NPDC050803]|uniref:hypothetical protein n=1 Tax=unclassified Streptomyces TaxID=2593676 RepID=UPI0034318091